MSYKFGDDTAYLLGRVTINPVKHTDPIGTLLIPAVAFVLGAVGGALGSIPLIGWGKPTPVNPRKWTRAGASRRRSTRANGPDTSSPT
jgi:Zn-dependent protease